MSDTGWEVVKTKEPIFASMLGKELGIKCENKGYLGDLSKSIFQLRVKGEVVSEIGITNNTWVYSYTPVEYRDKGYAKILATKVLTGSNILLAQTITGSGKNLVEKVLKEVGSEIKEKAAYKNKTYFSWTNKNVIN